MTLNKHVPIISVAEAATVRLSVLQLPRILKRMHRLDEEGRVTDREDVAEFAFYLVVGDVVLLFAKAFSAAFRPLDPSDGTAIRRRPSRPCSDGWRHERQQRPSPSQTIPVRVTARNGNTCPQNTHQPPANAVFRRTGRCATPRRTLPAAETRLTAVQSGHCGPVSSDFRHSGTHLHGFRLDDKRDYKEMLADSLQDKYESLT